MSGSSDKLILNLNLQIQRQGMLTYQDFCFLLNLLSTPRRYMDIGFHCFDVSADGNVDAKVRFIYRTYILQF